MPKLSGIITLQSLLFSPSTLGPVWAMGHFLKKRSAEKNDSTPQERKRRQFKLQGQLLNLSTHARGCFWGPEFMTFPQNGYLFCFVFFYCFKIEWIHLGYKQDWDEVFSGTDNELFDRKCVFVCMRAHFISKETNNIFICSLVLFPNCPTSTSPSRAHGWMRPKSQDCLFKCKDNQVRNAAGTWPTSVKRRNLGDSH